MTFTIDLTLTEEARLVAGAKQRGIAPEEFLKRLVTDHLPQSAEMTFAEILAPVHQYSEEQGETDEELGVFADAEVAAYRAARHMNVKSDAHE